MQSSQLKRRKFLTVLGGTAAWPLAVRAQQPAMPVIGYLSIRSAGAEAPFLVSFRQGLSATGLVEGRNVAVEYRFAEGRFERLPALAGDLVGRQVALIVATGGTPASLAAKAATATIPIVFTTGDDPVQAGLVQSLNRPGGNLTGVTTSFGEAAPKRLGLLREILPRATIIGVLVNP
jgi:putative tryptophan/tyrosine transport system substrate-binding protein